MSPLFRKSAEKVAQQAAAQAEIKRLKALPLTDFAAELLTALGPDGANHGYSVRVQQLCTYLLRDFPRAGQLTPLDLMSRARAGLEKLERAELVYPISHQRAPVWRITPLGEAALADGTVMQHLREAG